MTVDDLAERRDDRTLDDYLALYAGSRGTAVWCRDFEWSYAELDAHVGTYAGGMASAGIGAGDVVAVFGNTRPECLAVFLACCRIGAAYLGLNPKSTLRELGFIYSDAQPQLLFTVLDDSITPAQRTTLGELLVRVDNPAGVVSDSVEGAIAWADFLASSAPILRAERDADRRPCAIVYTSGSTGVPKGAMLSEAGCVRSAFLTWQHWFGGEPAMRALAQHPINHVSWLVCECLAVLVGGGALFFRERFDGGSSLQLIEDHRLTLWLAFPTMVALAMQSEEWERADLSSLRRIAFASSPQLELMKRFRERSGCVFSTSYGLTEAHGGAVTATDAAASLTEVAASIGRPVPGLGIRIVDEAGAEVEAGNPGELLIRDMTVFLGYLNRPGATAETVDQDGWLHTGDIVREAAGKALELVGRTKEMFKSGGYNVYPPEVEGVIGGHRTVIQAVVVDAPDPLWSAVGVAYLVPAEPSSFDKAELLAYVRSQLANYKVPKHIVVMKELPRLGNGKVDRSLLREQAKSLVATDGPG